MTEKIELVLFDMDNVLCRYNRHVRAARLAEMSGISATKIYNAIWNSDLEAMGDSGTLSRAQYLQIFGEKIGYALTLEQWIDARRFSTHVDWAMLELVNQLRNTVGIAVLTNNSELVTDHIDRIVPELRPLFGAHIYASARFGAAKPDTICYARCLDTLSVRPQNVLFVDDLVENVEGAIQSSLNAHHFTTIESFRADLSRYILQTGAK